MSVNNTATNKARQKAARERWLKRRHSPDVRDRMASRWASKHSETSVALPGQVLITVIRYGTAVPLYVNQGVSRA